jgi:enediyne biosynthesis protein E4
MVFFNVDEPVRVLRNVSQDNNHWLGVELVAKDHRHLAGAKLTLEVGGRKLDRYLLGGGSYLSAHDMRMIFGLGQETKVGKLTVEWPSGEPKTQTFDPKDLTIDKYNKLEQK